MNVLQITPTSKDLDRVRAFDFYKSGMRNWFYGNGAPITSLASKQAKLIKCKIKLVRRAKAVAAVWGTRDYTGFSAGQPQRENVWKPFEEALRNAGFSRQDITTISQYTLNAA